MKQFFISLLIMVSTGNAMAVGYQKSDSYDVPNITKSPQEDPSTEDDWFEWQKQLSLFDAKARLLEDDSVVVKYMNVVDLLAKSPGCVGAPSSKSKNTTVALRLRFTDPGKATTISEPLLTFNTSTEASKLKSYVRDIHQNCQDPKGSAATYIGE